MLTVPKIAFFCYPFSSCWGHCRNSLLSGYSVVPSKEWTCSNNSRMSCKTNLLSLYGRRCLVTFNQLYISSLMCYDKKTDTYLLPISSYEHAVNNSSTCKILVYILTKLRLVCIKIFSILPPFDCIILFLFSVQWILLAEKDFNAFSMQ